MLIHVYRGLIPVKDFPSHAIALLGNRSLRKTRHKRSTDALASKLGSHEQIFDEDSRSSLPRRVVVEEKGHARRFSIPLCNDHSKLRAGSESVAAQVFLCAGDSVRCPFVFGQLSNERQY